MTVFGNVQFSNKTIKKQGSNYCKTQEGGFFQKEEGAKVGKGHVEGLVKSLARCYLLTKVVVTPYNCSLSQRFSDSSTRGKQSPTL